jgi:hypothetical protein
MDKTKALIVGGVYVLGALGMFIAKFMELRHIGGAGQAGVDAGIAALIWPIEVLRMIL